MARPKAITLMRSATNPQPGYDPEPFVLVGTLPAGAFVETALPATPATFADLAAARTAVEALRAALASSPYFS